MIGSDLSNLTSSSLFLRHQPASLPSVENFSQQTTASIKPPVSNSLTSSHGPMGQSGPLLHQISLTQSFNAKKMNKPNCVSKNSQCIKENCSKSSNMQQNEAINRNSCPTNRKPIFSNNVGSKSHHSKSLRSSCASQTKNVAETMSRGSSKSFKGDRFIPYRGTTDNFLEEYIMSNQFHKEKKSKETQEDGQTRENQASGNQQNQGNGNQRNNASATNNNNNDQSNYSSNSSNESGNIHYSRGSGHNKQQNFQELITESLFTNRRGSPNTMTAKEEDDLEMEIHNKVANENEKGRGRQGILQTQRILSFKEKKPRNSLSLQKNLSLITALAQEKTQMQQKSLRFIPQFPEKILDAPDLVDDYYLNLLDWNSSNHLAVCLATTVYLWNSTTGEIQQLFDTENDNDIVTSVQWMKGSPVLAIGTQSKQIQLWDSIKFERIKTIQDQHEGRVSSLSWNPYQPNLLSSGSLDSLILNNDIRINNCSSLISTFKAHRQEVCGLKWSPDGQQLASGGNDNLLCIWDINSRMRNPFQSGSSNPFSLNMLNSNVQQPRYCFNDHKAAVKALAWCPWQKSLLASGGGSRDQCIKFWNTDTGSLLNSVQTDSQVCALQWNPFEKEILSSHGFINNQLCIWKYPTMKKIADLRGHTSRVLHLSLSPDGTTVASAAADETLRFWKVFQQNSNMNGKGQAMSLGCGDVQMNDASKIMYNTSVLGNGMNLR